MFKSEVQFEGTKDDAQDPRIIITSPEFPEGVHIEIHLSEDGAIFVDVFDSMGHELRCPEARTISFDDLMESYDTADYKVVCYTEGCENYGKAFNYIRDLEPEDLEQFAEDFGHGGEDEDDFCPKCGKLGTLEENDR